MLVFGFVFLVLQLDTRLLLLQLTHLLLVLYLKRGKFLVRFIFEFEELGVEGLELGLEFKVLGFKGGVLLLEGLYLGDLIVV